MIANIVGAMTSVNGFSRLLCFSWWTVARPMICCVGRLCLVNRWMFRASLQVHDVVRQCGSSVAVGASGRHDPDDCPQDADD